MTAQSADSYFVFDLFILFYGISGLLSCIKMAAKRSLIPSRFILPFGKSLDDCNDKNSYYRKILPFAFIYSSINLLCGLLNLLGGIFPQLFPSWLTWITIPVFLISILVFGLVLSKAVKRYWPA